MELLDHRRRLILAVVVYEMNPDCTDEPANYFFIELRFVCKRESARSFIFKASKLVMSGVG